MSNYHVRLALLKLDIILHALYLAGEVILDGNDFRNGAHFRFKADLFVPCGGRYV
jgi:hypothetical protein